MSYRIDLPTAGTYKCVSVTGVTWGSWYLGRDTADASRRFDEEAATLARVDAPSAHTPRALVFVEDDGHVAIVRVVTPAGGDAGHAEFRAALLAQEAELAARIAAEYARLEAADHDCMDHAVEVKTGGPLGHGWECGHCGAFLQAG